MDSAVDYRDERGIIASKDYGMSGALKIAEPPGLGYAGKNRLQPEDAAIHGWYRFVLGYPPHLVREYLHTLGANPAEDWVFDPFSGTATTPVEARLQGFSTLSADANRIAVLATRVKLAWDVDLDEVQRTLLDDVLPLTRRCLRRVNLRSAPEETRQLPLSDAPFVLESSANDGKGENGFDPNMLLPHRTAALIPKGFISEKPLHRVLALKYAIDKVAGHAIRDLMRLALANTIVTTAGNVGFGPEVYRLPPKEDADVLGSFADVVLRMVSDLRKVRATLDCPPPPAYACQDDARTLAALGDCSPIGIVITSPPYPNEKDYTRSTRLESILLGLIADKRQLRQLKSGLLRSNTRNVFVRDNDDRFIRDIPSIVCLAQEIEERRRQLGKTSGFERLYHRVTRLYFGGMYRHLAALWPKLRPGARCAYVVGDQMSYFRIHIRTAELLADVAVKVGYQVEGIELWRTRRSTRTRLDLAENVLILRRPS